MCRPGDLVWTDGADKVKSVPILRTSAIANSAASAERQFLMSVDHQPESVDFSVVTLDAPERFEPGFHIFWASKVGWFEPKDDLPRHERFRPNTRGLEGTEPPGVLTRGASLDCDPSRLLSSHC